MASTALVHRFGATAAGTPVNAYLVEGADGVVAVDATLTVSDGRALRARADALGKPLLGVAVTHTHPDHTAAWRSSSAASTSPSSRPRASPP